MGYLNDYIHYNSGHEVPEVYTLWSALSLLGAVLGRKVWYDWGYGKVYPNLYVALVGTAGSGKSTAKGFARALFRREFPLMMLSDSVQSWEDIAMKMASTASLETWKDDLGVVRDYRAFYLIVNEMRNFFSVAPEKMVNFLVDIYDEESFSTGFKRQAIDNPDIKQSFENPYLSLLACVQPEWFMSNLKLDLFSGGLGRRLIIVSAEKKKLIAKPKKPPGGDEAWLRAISHLHLVKKEECQGRFTMTPAGDAWWVAWYENPKRKDKEDPILLQFAETEHMQLLKIAMLLAKSEDVATLLIDEPHLEAGAHMLRSLEENIVRLTSGIGRNELAGVGAQIIDFLKRTDEHAATEIHLKKFFHRYLNTPEFAEVINHYISTHQLIVHPIQDNGLSRNLYILPGGPFHIKIVAKAKAASLLPLPPHSSGDAGNV